MSENEDEYTPIGDFEAALGAGYVLAKTQTDLPVPYVVIPEGYRLENLEHLLNAPTRKRGTVTLRDEKSFIRYHSIHDGLGTYIYGTLTPPQFTVVFDDHDAGDMPDRNPGWGEFRAVYECPLSVEWLGWMGKNKSSFAQTDFAQFIEDNLPDIVTPSGADMLEISRSLEAKKKVNFASGIRLSNGQAELTYEEEIQGTAAKGKLQIPEVFQIGIPVLEGGERYQVDARLRYRIHEGRLSMGYDLVRPHKVLEAAVKEVWQRIEEKAQCQILHGVPRA